MLAQTLRTLEADGFVHREAFPVIPPKVEYSLTPLGDELGEYLVPLMGWVARARRRGGVRPGLTGFGVAGGCH